MYVSLFMLNKGGASVLLSDGFAPSTILYAKWEVGGEEADMVKYLAVEDIQEFIALFY